VVVVSESHNNTKQQSFCQKSRCAVQLIKSSFNNSQPAQTEDTSEDTGWLSFRLNYLDLVEDRSLVYNLISIKN